MGVVADDCRGMTDGAKTGAGVVRAAGRDVAGRLEGSVPLDPVDAELGKSDLGASGAVSLLI